jgi:hypothetical protein
MSAEGRHMKGRTVTMRKALSDARLLGDALHGPSWANWRVFLIAALGEALTPQERAIFKRFTGREHEPGQRVEEALFLIGRRGGKDRAIAALAAYLAALVDWTGVLARGERGLVLCVGADQRQAQVQKNYVEGVFDSSPLLSPLVVNRTNDTIELSNGILIEVRASSFKRLRGVTCVAIIASEAAFWASEETSANADTEILGALRPTLATTHGPLLMITTPYARRGVVWDTYKQHYGAKGDPLVLVAQGTTRDFNPTLPQRVIDRAMERDPAAASAEYLAIFRTDVETLIAREAVEACVISGRHELRPVSGTSYVAFCDPSGGSGNSMALAIAHRDKNGRVVLDCVREHRAPFNPDTVVAEFAAVLKSYGITTVKGDQFADKWPEERFRAHGIEYVVAERPKADLYRDLLPLLNSGGTELLDHPRLVAQLCGLERSVTRSGKEQINPAPGAMDDLANAVAGVLALALVSVPSLWAADALLVAGAPTPLPRECMFLFAVVVSDKHERCGIAYFLPRLGWPLIVLDWELKDYLTPTVLTDVAARLGELSVALRAAKWSIFTTSGLEQEFRALGVGGVEAVDAVIGDEDGLLRLAVAKHINAHKVKSAKPDHRGLTGLLESREENPLKSALLTGIVLALDPGRSSSSSAPRRLSVNRNRR